MRGLISRIIISSFLVHFYLLVSPVVCERHIKRAHKKISLYSDKIHSQERDCSYVFIDCGSNRGDGINSFLKPFKIPSEIIGLSIWTKEFIMKDLGLNPNQFCVFGFEGNPAFNSKLVNLEKQYNEEGFFLKTFPQTVVADHDGTVPFYINHNKKHYDWGSSLSYSKTNVAHNEDPVIANSVNLARFIVELTKVVTDEQNIQKIPPKEWEWSKLSNRKMTIVRMDIEGGEYLILPSLIQTGALCVITDLLLEWHPPRHFGGHLPYNASLSFASNFEKTAKQCLRLHKKDTT